MNKIPKFAQIGPTFDSGNIKKISVNQQLLIVSQEIQQMKIQIQLI